jgi:phosphatidylinositol glycan class Z
MATSAASTSLAWAIYFTFLLVRVIIASILPGYLHPDEFFQGGQELFYGCPPIMIPWEFKSAIRSIVPPTIMTYLPLQLYQSLFLRNSQDSLTGWEILVIPRIFCGFLSILTVDASIYHLTKAIKRGTVFVKATPTNSQWILQTAWPVWVILHRPFTNGLETVWLALLLLLVSRLQNTKKADVSKLETLALGATCALGIFTRFTFVFFAIPAMLQYLWNKRSALLEALTCALGFVITFVLFVAIDTSYYGYMVVTPWNALRYNSQVSNLKEHGLHPHWTHALVNMMLLFGPMTLLFYHNLILRVIFLGSRANTKANADDCLPTGSMHNVYIWTIVCGLTSLSLAPHQEPRFLAPLVVPLSVLMGASCESLWKSTKLRIVWICFNAILLLVFGVLHQGGVVPSLLSSVDVIGEQDSGILLFRKTYMPPSFLSRRRQHCGGDQTCKNACPVFEVIDLQGDYNLEEVSKRHCDRGEATKFVHLVAPPQTMHSNFLVNQQIESKWSYWPHLTTEDLPLLVGKESLTQFSSRFRLETFSIECAA